MEKVDEPNVGEIRECPRCMQNHCSNCVDFIMVDFAVCGISEGYKAQEQEWENREVCPWCYNQLLKLQMEVKENVKNK